MGAEFRSSPRLRGEGGVERRSLLKLSAIASTMTGALALSSIGATEAQANTVSDPAPNGADAGTVQILDRVARAGIPQQRGRGAIVFTWDDNHLIWRDSIVPLANRLSQKHTFCLRTDQIEQPGRLTATDIAGFHAAGHEIASHSVSHRSMPTLSIAESVTEMDVSRTTLESIIGAGQVTTLVWPYGAYNDELKAMAYGRYERHVVVANQYIFPHSDHATTGKVGRFNWEAGKNDHLKALIRMAASQPVRIVVMGHEPGGAGQCTLAETLECMQLAYDLGVPCITLKEAFPSWYTIPNPGFEEGLAGWEPEHSGSGTVAAVTDSPYTGLAGTMSLKLSTADVGSTASATAVGIVQSNSGRWAIQGRARAVIRASGVGGAFMEVLERDGAGTVIARTSTPAITSSTWSKFSTLFTPDSRTAYVQVRARLENCNADAYFDHISLGTANDVSG